MLLGAQGCTTLHNVEASSSHKRFQHDLGDDPCNGMQHNATLFSYSPRAGRQCGLPAAPKSACPLEHWSVQVCTTSHNLEASSSHKRFPRNLGDDPCNGMRHNATLFAHSPRPGRQGGLPVAPRVLARFVRRELRNLRRVSPMGRTPNTGVHKSAQICTTLHSPEARACASRSPCENPSDKSTNYILRITSISYPPCPPVPQPPAV